VEKELVQLAAIELFAPTMVMKVWHWQEVFANDGNEGTGNGGECAKP